MQWHQPKGRTMCAVPGCKRTVSAEKGFDDWVCRKHWPGVRKSTRNEYNLTLRRARKILARKPKYREWWKLPPGSPDRLHALALRRRVESAWLKCKTEAIETAMGI